ARPRRTYLYTDPAPPMLATRCAIAQAICINENGDDAEQALACLMQAEDKFGFDIRFRARVPRSTGADAIM
ncbi:hypothetical protein, partial [Bradyrhizobium ottawaense]